MRGKRVSGGQLKLGSRRSVYVGCHSGSLREILGEFVR